MLHSGGAGAYPSYASGVYPGEVSSLLHSKHRKININTPTHTQAQKLMKYTL